MRNFGALAGLDLLFSAAFVAMLSSLLGLAPVPIAAIMVALAALRVFGYWNLFQRYVQPTEAVQSRAARGRGVGADALQRADTLLQDATRVLTTFTALAWAVSLPAAIISYRALVGPTALHMLEIWTVGALAPVGGLGAIGIASPLLTWGLASGAGQNHVLAREAGIVLERSHRSIALRVAVLGFCLAGVPTLLVTSALLATVDHGEYVRAQEEARAMTQEARRHLVERAAGVGAVEEYYGGDRATWLVLEPGAELRSSGAEPPSWATEELLRSAVDGGGEPPDRRFVIHAMALADGRVVGSLVRLDGIHADLVALLLSVLLVSALFGMSSAWLLSRSVSAPLQHAARLADRAAVDGDLSQIGTAPVAQLDEVGMVLLSLNGLIDGMRVVAQAAGEVGAGNLAVDIAGKGELPDAFRQMLAQLQGVVGEMHAMSVELGGAAMEILAASQEQEAATTSHSTGMTEIAQTMDSLAGSAAHVATAVQGVLENAERTLQNTDQMVLRIDELTGHANRIGDILDVIREIADRTDLLALNGSLEASRAGEAGVGFSLVASEMRRLAERVTASVGNIKTLVADIRESGASTVVATEESKKLAEGTTQAARKITLVTQQQQSSTEQVTQNVRSVAEVIQLAATATSQTKESAEGLKKQADRLTELVRRFQLAR